MLYNPITEELSNLSKYSPKVHEKTSFTSVVMFSACVSFWAETVKNLENESVSLSNFADKLVLLNFWNTHCEGCIARTPQKNALVEKYGKQGFELVNICLEDAPEACQQIVKDNNALGSHLICKGKWAQNLLDSYWITGVAHYTLIDRNGLIIKNHIEPDSIVYYIEKYISLK